jgi:transcriptional activator SPT7
MASKSSGAEPSKKKSKKNSGVALEMPNFNPDGEADQTTGDPATNAMKTEEIGLGDGDEPITNGA